MTTPENRPEPQVVYGVKELLQDIRLSIERLDTKLDSKADKSDVAVLSQRVDTHDRRLDGHDFRMDETEKKAQDNTATRRFRIPLIATIVFNIASPFLWFGVNHIH